VNDITVEHWPVVCWVRWQAGAALAAARNLSYQLKVLVQGQDCAAGYFGEGRDEKVRDRWCTMLIAVGQNLQCSQ
jgi:hypothetical protein